MTIRRRREVYLSIAEIADLLAVSRWKIRKEITDGKLEAIRVTDRGDFRISERAYNEWLANRDPAA
jgi:excisionase family DNA binding protein